MEFNEVNSHSSFVLVGQNVALVADELDGADPFDALLVVEVYLLRLFLLGLELNEGGVSLCNDDRASLLGVELYVAEVGAVKLRRVALDDTVTFAFVLVVPGKDQLLRSKQKLLLVAGAEGESDAGLFVLERALLLNAPIITGRRVAVEDNYVGQFDLALDQVAAEAETDAAVVFR